jgi:hypothetical protein
LIKTANKFTKIFQKSDFIKFSKKKKKMSGQDDWEKAYEAERAALASGGGDLRNARRFRQNNEEDIFAAYYGNSSSAQPNNNNNNTNNSSSTSKPEAEVFVSQQPKTEDVLPKGRRDAALDDLYRGGSSSSSSSKGPGSFPEDDDPRDCRYDLAFEAVPQHLSAMFRDRISPYCFFVEPCEFYVRGAVFGQNKLAALAVVTSHGVHFFDTTDGSMIVGMPIRQLGTMFVLGPQGVGLRSGNPQNKYDIFVKFQRRREVLVEIVKKLFKKYKADEYGEGGDLHVAEGSDEREKSYRAEVKWLKKGEFVYAIEDDPRSGLELVLVPAQHKAAYAPLVPKILHYFGGVNQISFQPNKVLSPQRRGCWITPGGIFLCLPAGPGEFGDNIRRCIYAENMRSIVLAEPNQVGVVIASGPPQPDLLLEFDGAALRSQAVFALRRIFMCRTHHPLFVRTLKGGENAAASLKLADETKFQPSFEPMFTVGQLVGHLQSPSVAKK